MVQSKRGSNEIYRVGCLGKISDFLETGDGSNPDKFGWYDKI